jgi:hypothetical protein
MRLVAEDLTSFLRHTFKLPPCPGWAATESQVIIQGIAFEERVVSGVPSGMWRLSVEGAFFADDTGERVAESLNGQASREWQAAGQVPEEADSK